MLSQSEEEKFPLHTVQTHQDVGFGVHTVYATLFSEVDQTRRANLPWIQNINSVSN